MDAIFDDHMPVSTTVVAASNRIQGASDMKPSRGKCLAFSVAHILDWKRHTYLNRNECHCICVYLHSVCQRLPAD